MACVIGEVCLRSPRSCAIGYPPVEACCTNVLAGGVQTQVLLEVSERRVLTYTPRNPGRWNVEVGNVGQHYQTWRYTQLGTTVTSDLNPPAAWSPPSPPPANSQSPPPGSTDDGIDYDCSDLSTQQQAQQHFNSQDGSRSNSVDGLDADRAGIAC